MNGPNTDLNTLSFSQLSEMAFEKDPLLFKKKLEQQPTAMLFTLAEAKIKCAEEILRTKLEKQPYHELYDRARKGDPYAKQALINQINRMNKSEAAYLEYLSSEGETKASARLLLLDFPFRIYFKVETPHFNIYDYRNTQLVELAADPTVSAKLLEHAQALQLTLKEKDLLAKKSLPFARLYLEKLRKEAPKPIPNLDFTMSHPALIKDLLSYTPTKPTIIDKAIAQIFNDNLGPICLSPDLASSYLNNRFLLSYAKHITLKPLIMRFPMIFADFWKNLSEEEKNQFSPGENGIPIEEILKLSEEFSAFKTIVPTSPDPYTVQFQMPVSSSADGRKKRFSF